MCRERPFHASQEKMNLFLALAIDDPKTSLGHKAGHWHTATIIVRRRMYRFLTGKAIIQPEIHLPFFRSRQLEDEPFTKSSEAYPSPADPPPGSGPSAGDAPPLDPVRRERFPMLALFRTDPSSRTPKSLTPRLGHVRELCPSWLQWEHRRVISPRLPSPTPWPPYADPPDRRRRRGERC